jgi:hypothetical protein
MSVERRVANGCPLLPSALQHTGGTARSQAPQRSVRARGKVCGRTPVRGKICRRKICRGKICSGDRGEESVRGGEVKERVARPPAMVCGACVSKFCGFIIW